MNSPDTEILDQTTKEQRKEGSERSPQSPEARLANEIIESAPPPKWGTIQ